MGSIAGAALGSCPPIKHILAGTVAPVHPLYTEHVWVQGIAITRKHGLHTCSKAWTVLTKAWQPLGEARTALLDALTLNLRLYVTPTACTGQTLLKHVNFLLQA